MKKLSDDVKTMRKAFTQLKKTHEEDDSDISDSDDDESEDGHFQMQVRQKKKGFQFAQLDSDFEPRIAKLFAQGQGTKIKLNLMEVILLDCQSTTDLFGNANMLERVYKSKSTLNLKSNGGNLKTRQKGKMTGYHTDVWYSKSDITNILSLGNVIEQYRVTYDSNDLMFVVHRGVNGKPDMHFRMHECGLHYYAPREQRE